MNTLNKTVILVNGIPASGKSSISKKICEHFGYPYLSIDNVKEPFMDKFDNIDRPFNRMLGYAAYEAIWKIVESSPSNCIFVIDAWFGFRTKEILKQYISASGVNHVIEIWNAVSGDIVSDRYLSRLCLRKRGHPGEEYVSELKTLAGNAQPMSLGDVYKIEQGSAINYDELFTWLRNHVQV